MNHLTSEDLLAYLDSDESSAKLKKVARHLDECARCTVKLKDYALINIFLELTIEQARERREKELLRECLSTEQMFGLIEKSLSPKERKTAEQHLEKCEDCRKELEILSFLEDTADVKVSEVRDPEKYLPKILRYVELYFVASERERAIAQEKKFIIPGLETIRKILFPQQPILAPLGFAEIPKRDKEFYLNLDEKDLMEACKNWDSMAWEAFIRRFSPYAFSIIHDYGLRKEREEIWQISLIAMLHSIKYYVKKGKVKYYIRKFVVNRCKAWIKKIKTGTQISLEELLEKKDEEVLNISKGSDPLTVLIDREYVERSRDKISRMPKDLSLILTLFAIHGFDDIEISQMLNISVDVVQKRKYKARVKFIEMTLEDQEFKDTIKGRGIKLIERIVSRSISHE